jgi:hypothetical protein
MLTDLYSEKLVQPPANISSAIGEHATDAFNRAKTCPASTKIYFLLRTKFLQKKKSSGKPGICRQG